jgi:hypothetical protein
MKPSTMLGESFFDRRQAQAYAECLGGEERFPDLR